MVKKSLFLLLVILSLALVACGGAAQAPETIKVGAVVPLSGPFAGGGAQVERGYQMAVEDINAAGGVFVEEYDAQIPLELILLDDESDPNATVSHLEALNSDEQVVAYLGGFGSSLHAAAAAIAEKNQIPYIGVAFALQQPHNQGFQYFELGYGSAAAVIMLFISLFFAFLYVRLMRVEL